MLKLSKSLENDLLDIINGDEERGTKKELMKKHNLSLYKLNKLLNELDEEIYNSYGLII